MILIREPASCFILKSKHLKHFFTYAYTYNKKVWHGAYACDVLSRNTITESIGSAFFTKSYMIKEKIYGEYLQFIPTIE